MFESERFYSRLGRSFKPGILTTIVLAAFELMKQGKKIISLTGGSYDPPSLPWAEVKRIFDEASPEAWMEMLQYGSTLGMSQLRVELAKFVSEAGVKADPDKEVIVTTGSQEAIDLVTRVFVDPGDIIIIGRPTYLSALSAFKQVNPDFLEISIDRDGMDADALEAELKRLKVEGRSTKLLYVIPSFQNPTSTVLSRERRLRLLELAEEHDFLIFEDNPYGYISFEGPMPTPLAGLDKSGRVMYMSTFSKIVSPGMRIGWLKAHEEFIAKMAEAKTRISICNDGLAQYAAAELLRRGVVARQIPKMIDVYRRKRDLMLEAMETSFPEEAEWNKPGGGLFLWAKMPEHVDTTEMLMEAVRSGVAYIPGSNFFTGPIHNYIRLNYSFPSEPDIVEGIQILGGLLKQKI
ncbi:MAG: PLP-dependent aminotransferase family protein [Candidatus Bathyarchaeia archaeon]